MEAVKIGVLGCGRVSPMYLPNVVRSPLLEVVAVSDVVHELAAAAAKTYGVAKVLSPEELLADPGVEMILNLTPIGHHVEMTTAALDAGKHVYSEKPLATTVEDARRLVAVAEGRGLLLGCAPDTLLGSGFQASRKRFAEGAIGRPLGAQGFMFRRMPPSPASATGAFAFFDMAPYYITALVHLLGPARRVTGSAQTLTAEQAAGGVKGALISFAGVIEFANRVLANVLLIWGTSYRSEVPFVKVFGTTGVLDVPNPNVFGDPGFVRPYDAAPGEEIADSRQPAGWPQNLRGLGVAELAAALREGRQPRAGADVACHVVEVIASIVSAADTGRHVDLTTTCTPPPPLLLAEEAALLGL